MKNLLKLVTVVFLLTFAISCDKSDDTLEINESAKLDSRQSVEKLDLDIQYGIDKDVYNEFLESLAFDEKGNFRGAIYTEVEKYLSDETSEKFWKNFGVTIRKIKEFNEKIKEGGPHIYSGYKPKPRGCKKNRRWICSMSGTVEQ